MAPRTNLPGDVRTVDKTGVYRAKDGTGIYLNQGDPVAQHVWDQVTYDAEGTEAHNAPATETDLFSYSKQAPQDQKATDTWSDKRMVPAAPENRMETPAQNRSDADLAASEANKGPKKS
jgi:hypothetical protein